MRNWDIRWRDERLSAILGRVGISKEVTAASEGMGGVGGAAVVSGKKTRYVVAYPTSEYLGGFLGLGPRSME